MNNRFNPPMSQFEVIAGCLTVMDTSRYDFVFGFRRVIRRFVNVG
jgi:hypothetical protein